MTERRRDRVYVDANKLFPFAVMDILLALAEDLIIDFVWSEELLDEWERVIVREGRRGPESARSVTLAVREHFASGRIDPTTYRNDVSRTPGPDPDDRVHAAAAIAGRATVLLTKNRRDFPADHLRDVYRTDDPDQVAGLLDDAIAWCLDADSGPELRRLAKPLRRCRTQILNHHSTGASNGPVEADNREPAHQTGQAFRSRAPQPAQLRARILLAGGQNPRWRTHTSRVSDPAVPGWSSRAPQRGRFTPNVGATHAIWVYREWNAEVDPDTGRAR